MDIVDAELVEPERAELTPEERAQAEAYFEGVDPREALVRLREDVDEEEREQLDEVIGELPEDADAPKTNWTPGEVALAALGAAMLGGAIGWLWRKLHHERPDADTLMGMVEDDSPAAPAATTEPSEREENGLDLWGAD